MHNNHRIYRYTYQETHIPGNTHTRRHIYKEGHIPGDIYQETHIFGYINMSVA